MNIIFHIFSIKATKTPMINVIKIIVEKHDGATSSVREIDHYDGRPDDTATDGTWDDDDENYHVQYDDNDDDSIK